MKLASTLCITLLSCLSLSAQVKFAISAGYNHNTARIHKNNVLQQTGDVPGANVNFRVETDFEAPLYFSGMIGYSMRGYEYKSRPDSTIKTNIHYVDIAPMFNYHIKTGNKNYINLFAGPLVGLAISGKQKINYNGETVSEPMKFSLSGYYGLANVAVQSGIAFHFDKWFIEGLYHLGVNSINNEEETDQTNIKNRGISLNIGYWLR
jgi:hypothetical protein